MLKRSLKWSTIVCAINYTWAPATDSPQGGSPCAFTVPCVLLPVPLTLPPPAPMLSGHGPVCKKAKLVLVKQREAEGVCVFLGETCYFSKGCTEAQVLGVLGFLLWVSAGGRCSVQGFQLTRNPSCPRSLAGASSGRQAHSPRGSEKVSLR